MNKHPPVSPMNVNQSTGLWGLSHRGAQAAPVFRVRLCHHKPDLSSEYPVLISTWVLIIMS